MKETKERDSFFLYLSLEAFLLNSEDIRKETNISWTATLQTVRKNDFLSRPKLQKALKNKGEHILVMYNMCSPFIKQTRPLAIHAALIFALHGWLTGSLLQYDSNFIDLHF